MCRSAGMGQPWALTSILAMFSGCFMSSIVCVSASAEVGRGLARSEGGSREETDRRSAAFWRDESAGRLTTWEEGTRTLGLILGELGLLGRLEGVGGGHVRLTALKSGVSSVPTCFAD